MYHYHNRFTALFPGPPGWANARRELLDFMLQGKINRGRHTDQPAGRHSIQTNQCPPPSSPHSLQTGCPSCCPTNSVKALKAMETCNNIQFTHSLNIMHIATNNATMYSTHHQQEPQHWKWFLPWQFIKILTEINAVAYQCLVQLPWQGSCGQSLTCVWVENVSSLQIDDESHEREWVAIIVEKQVRVRTAMQNTYHINTDIAFQKRKTPYS